MKPADPRTLTNNGGWSSSNFALYQVGQTWDRALYRKVERIGLSGTNRTFNDPTRKQAKKVLEQNMSVSTALPCRISIYEEGGKTILATLRPTTRLAMFNTPQLGAVAQEVENTIVKIMKRAASG